MQVPPDENLPHDLRHFLHMHQAFTVAYPRWQGLENGDLLARAAAGGFDVPVTQDRNLHSQQNLRGPLPSQSWSYEPRQTQCMTSDRSYRTCCEPSRPWFRGRLR